MIPMQLTNKLVDLLEQRLANNTAPSIYVNIQNPKGISKVEADVLHYRFIEAMKNKNEGKEIDCFENPYVLSIKARRYELTIEKLFTVDDNILLVSLSPASVTFDVNQELLSDMVMLRQEIKEVLGAKDVSIKVTY